MKKLIILIVSILMLVISFFMGRNSNDYLKIIDAETNNRVKLIFNMELSKAAIIWYDENGNTIKRIDFSTNVQTISY